MKVDGETAQALTGIHGRGAILRALEAESVPAHVVVGPGGQIRVLAREWPDYWGPVYEAGAVALQRSVEALHEAWRAYICSGFDAALRREYCLRYFLLLDGILEEIVGGPVRGSFMRALQVTLSFECFGISAADSPEEAAAAATSTLRNPCYLLAKLKAPDTADDSRFLPLITVSGTSDARIFYHYRQHRLARDSEHSVLTYLDTECPRRAESFRVVSRIEGTLGHGRDPRAAERARLTTDRVLVPYLSARASRGAPLDFELVDLGAGSGLLAARICGEVDRFLSRRGIAHKVRVWMIDLVPPRPGRFYSRGPLRRATDSLASVGVEYRNWLVDGQRLPPPRGVRVAIASYLFNNVSAFAISRLSREAAAKCLGEPAGASPRTDCLPSVCLQPGARGPEALKLAGSHTRHEGGRVYAQPSLSQFYRGLYALGHPPRSEERRCRAEDGLFLPVRRFRPESLLAEDGSTVLSRLLDDCALLIVEDADLEPEELAEHGKRTQSEGIIAIDMTRVLGLRRRHSYALLHSTDPALGALTGERLW